MCEDLSLLLIYVQEIFFKCQDSFFMFTLNNLAATFFACDSISGVVVECTSQSSSFSSLIACSLFSLYDFALFLAALLAFLLTYLNFSSSTCQNLLLQKESSPKMLVLSTIIVLSFLILACPFFCSKLFVFIVFIGVQSTMHSHLLLTIELYKQLLCGINQC